ncbi:MAG: thioredoxin family protein [Candidatus Marinimicrobia bacterium]|nr:thioredoxin family protein [Candidatus Neomarinimicrobiota bacterium]
MRSKNKKRVLFTILTVSLLVAGLLLTGCSDKKTKEEPKKATVVTSTDKLPKMVDFWAPTCPPCRQMIPILHELEDEYAHAFKLVKIDTSKPENREIAMENQIQYIPTQIFYDENGKQLFRHVGFFSKQQILDKWIELGYEMSQKVKD